MSTGRHSNHRSVGGRRQVLHEGRKRNGGAEGSRTPDPKTASLVLSQLSYSPTREITLQARAERCQGMVPGAGVEPARPRGHWILSPAWLPLHHPGPDSFYMFLAVSVYNHPTRGRPTDRFGARPSGAKNFATVARLRARQGTSGA